jgi:hypothetical protein
MTGTTVPDERFDPRRPVGDPGGKADPSEEHVNELRQGKRKDQAKKSKGFCHWPSCEAMVRVIREGHRRERLLTARRRSDDESATWLTTT